MKQVVTVRERMRALLSETTADPTLVTDVKVSVETYKDSFGLTQQRYVGTGRYDGKAFHARLGKTRYGQPQWKFFKSNSDEKDPIRKRIRKVISSALKSAL